jgi:hypothetical protein
VRKHFLSIYITASVSYQISYNDHFDYKHTCDQLYSHYSPHQMESLKSLDFSCHATDMITMLFLTLYGQLYCNLDISFILTIVLD